MKNEAPKNKYCISDELSLVDMTVVIADRFRIPIADKRIDSEKFLQELSQSKNVTSREKHNILCILEIVKGFKKRST